MVYQVNKSFLLEEFSAASAVAEENRKRVKLGQAPMNGEEMHNAMLEHKGKNLKTLSRERAERGKRESINSNNNSNTSGNLGAREAEQLKLRLRTSGYL